MPKIDKERFQRVLERAIELDADHDEHLSERDVYAAGKELGLSDESVREAIAQIEAEDGEAPPEYPRPRDTTVSIEKGPKGLRLHVPALGLTRQLLVAFILSKLSTTWFAFALCWVIGVAIGAGLPALVGLPFCVIGAMMVSVWVRAAWQVDELQITGEGCELRSWVGPFRWKQPLVATQLRASFDQGRGRRGARINVPAVPHLLIENGTQRLQIMAGRSEAELRWVNEELGRWLVRSAAKSRG